MNDARRRLMFDLAVWIGALASTFALVATAEAGPRSVALDPSYRAECGACHVAYPPSLLAASDWQRIMGSLDRHFGNDASLDAATASRIDRFLASNAGNERHASNASPPRITSTRWFVHEHREAVSAKATTEFANCGACHPGAAQGDFDEHAVRMPRR